MDGRKIRKMTDQILAEEMGVESALKEGFASKLGADLRRQASGAIRNLAVSTAAMALLSLAGVVVSKLMAPKAKNKQHKVISDFYPPMVKEALENIKPELTDVIMSGAAGLEVDISGMMDKSDAKIDRVVDKYLPHIFKALGEEIRNDVKDMIQWEVEQRADKYAREVANKAQHMIGQSF